MGEQGCTRQIGPRCWLVLHLGLLGVLAISMLDDMGVIDRTGGWHVAWLASLAVLCTGAVWLAAEVVLLGRRLSPPLARDL